jgi:hypothetical protein
MLVQRAPPLAVCRHPGKSKRKISLVPIAPRAIRSMRSLATIGGRVQLKGSSPPTAQETAGDTWKAENEGEKHRKRKKDGTVKAKKKKEGTVRKKRKEVSGERRQKEKDGSGAVRKSVKG